jgi:CheY-like chemotaxis protein
VIQRDIHKVCGLRALVVDDNSANRQILRHQLLAWQMQPDLRKLGYKAEAVANGLEAVRALEQIPYDMILMGCQMPELDGYEATQTIRKREKALEGRCPWKVPVHIIAMNSARHVGRARKMSCPREWTTTWLNRSGPTT